MNQINKPHIAEGDHKSANPSMMQSECWSKNKQECMFLDEEHIQHHHHTTFVNTYHTTFVNHVFYQSTGNQTIPQFPIFPT